MVADNTPRKGRPASAESPKLNPPGDTVLQAALDELEPLEAAKRLAELKKLAAEERKLDAEATEVESRTRFSFKVSKATLMRWFVRATVAGGAIAIWWIGIFDPGLRRAQVNAEIGRLEARHQQLLNDSIDRENSDLAARLAFQLTNAALREERARGLEDSLQVVFREIESLLRQVAEQSSGRAASEEQAALLQARLDAASEEPGAVAVLWVDDNRDNNASLVRRLRTELGMDVNQVESTDEALQQLRLRPYDLVVTDISRPPDRRAGYTLLAAARSEGFDAPVIAYAMSSDLERHDREFQAADGWGMAMTPSRLLELVRTALELPSGL